MSTQGVRYHPRQPVAFRLLVSVCQIPPALAGLWWRALQRSTWSTPVAWRQALLLHASLPGSISGDVAFMQDICTPLAVHAVLDALRQEGRLTPRQAGQLSDKVLGMVDRDGRWK